MSMITVTAATRTTAVEVTLTTITVMRWTSFLGTTVAAAETSRNHRRVEAVVAAVVRRHQEEVLVYLLTYLILGRAVDYGYYCH